MKVNINNLVKFSNYLADNARKISLRYYKRKIKIVSKNSQDFDPVTIADIKIQKELNKLINLHYPDHSVLGEEASVIKKSKYEW